MGKMLRLALMMKIVILLFTLLVKMSNYYDFDQGKD